MEEHKIVIFQWSTQLTEDEEFEMILLGELNYEAYCSALGNSSLRRTFWELEDKQMEAWINAAQAVKKHCQEYKKQ